MVVKVEELGISGKFCGAYMFGPAVTNDDVVKSIESDIREILSKTGPNKIAVVVIKDIEIDGSEIYGGKEEEKVSST